MRVEDIMVDPERFQFRVAAWASGGTDDRLSGCKIFNANLAGVLAVWRDRADGLVYLCDGHHRLKLARRDGVQHIAVQFLEAGSDIEARSWAALKNIAEGHATATDAARWLVDSGSDAAALEAWGLSLRSALVGRALRLKSLPPALLTQACNGELPEDFALAIAQAGDPVAMADLWRLAQQKGWDLDQVAEAALMARGCTVTTRQAEGVIPPHWFASIRAGSGQR